MHKARDRIRWRVLRGGRGGPSSSVSFIKIKIVSKKESDGVLHHMTWPPQSPDLNPIDMVWDELDRRVKENQPRSAQHMWELLQSC